MGQTIDQITLINTAQGVQGIDRARILIFNVVGQPGQVVKHHRTMKINTSNQTLLPLTPKHNDSHSSNSKRSNCR